MPPPPLGQRAGGTPRQPGRALPPATKKGSGGPPPATKKASGPPPTTKRATPRSVVPPSTPRSNAGKPDPFKQSVTVLKRAAAVDAGFRAGGHNAEQERAEARRRAAAEEAEASNTAALVGLSGPRGEMVEGGPFEGVGLSVASVVEACHRLPRIISDASRSETLEDIYHRFVCAELSNVELRDELKKAVGARQLWDVLCGLAPILATPVKKKAKPP